MGRPSRPKFGRRGHWKIGGSVVARAPAAAPGSATAVLVVPLGVAVPEDSGSENVVWVVGLPLCLGGLACHDSEMCNA